MSREYKKIKYLQEEILDMKENGYTYREIGEQFGYTRMQVKEFMKRYRQKFRKLENPTVTSKRRGRPRKTPITTQRELELEVNRLKMENELLRNFLQSIGRR